MNSSKALSSCTPPQMCVSTPLYWLYTHNVQGGPPLLNKDMRDGSFHPDYLWIVMVPKWIPFQLREVICLLAGDIRLLLATVHLSRCTSSSASVNWKRKSETYLSVSKGMQCRCGSNTAVRAPLGLCPGASVQPHPSSLPPLQLMWPLCTLWYHHWHKTKRTILLINIFVLSPALSMLIHSASAQALGLGS